MREDRIVEEVRKYREERAAKFGYDLRAIAEDAGKREQQGGRQIVSFIRLRPTHEPNKRSST